MILISMYFSPKKINLKFLISSSKVFCCCSVAKSCLTLGPVSYSIPNFLSFTVSQSLLKLMTIELVMLLNYFILCHPFSFCFQSFPASGSFPVNQPFASGGQSWSFNFSVSPSYEYSGLISFRSDWFWSPCCPKDSQESFLEPQFESTNSLVLNLLYCPTTPVHDY